MFYYRWPYQIRAIYERVRHVCMVNTFDKFRNNEEKQASQNDGGQTHIYMVIG